MVGGCCELNADAHRLLAEIGALRGRQAARESGEGERACGALELLQLRQRMSVRIWSSYQRYICARVQYADPTHDTQRQHAHHAEVAAAKQELQAQRHINQAHTGRRKTRRPLAAAPPVMRTGAPGYDNAAWLCARSPLLCVRTALLCVLNGLFFRASFFFGKKRPKI